ncbi:MAG: hypothetical protein JXR64_06535 [Spirochaetales bacterium]|nr:hypothetical protein [Spirochaetales bacterium]
MKLKIGIILIGLLVLMASCQLNTTRGSIPLTLPESNSVREIGEYTVARIYLQRGDNFVKIDPSSSVSYVDVPASSGSYTISDINTAYKYNLIVMFGSEVNETFANYSSYAIAQNVSITEGEDNVVNMEIKTSDFVWDSGYLGVNSKQVLSINNNLVVFGDKNSFENKSNYTITSVGKGINSAGAEELWLNTSTGIYTLDGNTILGDKTGLNIEESGAIKMDNEDGSNELIAYYQGVGNVGVTAMDYSKNYTDWDWFGKTEIIDFVPDMEDMLKGLDKLLYGFVSLGSYAYVSTTLPVSAFKITNKVIDDSKNLSDSPSFDDLTKLVEFVPVRDSNNSLVTVKCLTYAKDVLYMGSDNGLYTAKGIIPNTNGVEFKKLVSNGTTVAALTDKGIMLFEEEALTQTYMFYQGLPLNITDIAYVDNKLYISGINGVVSLE